jgi:hypothetical protein
MKERIMLVLALAPLLMSMLFATVGTRMNLENDASNSIPYCNVKPQNAAIEPQAVVGQNSTTAARLQNVTEANIPAGSWEIKTQLQRNTPLITPIPFTSKPDQPNDVPPGRIRRPGLFPVFYDGIGDPASGPPYTAERVGATASGVGQ